MFRLINLIVLGVLILVGSVMFGPCNFFHAVVEEFTGVREPVEDIDPVEIDLPDEPDDEP